MRHLNHTNTSSPVVADEWLDATAKATAFVIDACGRPDLHVKLGPGFAAAAGTAMFSPALAQIEVDTNVMLPGVKPEAVYFNDDLFRARHPLLIGALLHEAGHALASVWTPLSLAADKRFSNAAIQVLTYLEESRIEKVIAERQPRLARQYLPSMVWDLIAKDTSDIPGDRYGASMYAALTLARVDTGVLSKADVKPIRDLLVPTLGEDTIDALEVLWREYHALTFRVVDDEGYVTDAMPLDAMHSIALRWFEALGMTTVAYAREAEKDAAGRPEAADKPEPTEAGEGAGEGDKGESEDESEGAGESAGDDEGDEDGDGAGDGDGDAASDESEASAEGDAAGAGEDGDEDESGHAAGGDDADPTAGGKGEGEDTEDGDGVASAGGDGPGEDHDESGEPFDPTVLDKVREAAAEAKHEDGIRHVEKVGDLKRKIREAERKAEAGRRAMNAKVEDKAFGPGGKAITGEVGNVGRLGMRSRIEWRKPTDRERAGASLFARALDRIMAQDKRVTKVAQAAPGGRLRSRAAVQKVAEKRAGKLVSDQKPWQVKRRALTDKPMLRVGVLLDVSGSMRAEAEAAATASYIIGNAVNRQGGMFTEVAFGASVHGITKPGVKIDAVAQIQPSDGTENFREGWRAMDSVLDLVSGDGLRVMFLLSDGHFVNEDDSREADVIIPWMVKQGVLVFQVDCSGDGSIRNAERRGLNLRHGNPLPVVEVPKGAGPEQIAEVLGKVLLDSVKKYKATANFA